MLIVPACEQGRGGGHISRCIKLTSDLRAAGTEAFLYFDSGENNLLETMRFNRSWVIDKDNLQKKSWDLIVLDRFQTSYEELAYWKQIAPVIGIDEGGAFRDSFDFLIDILPNLNKIKPNISDPRLLPLPRRSINDPHTETKLKILISFGQEDAAGLGIAVTQALLNSKTNDIEITLLKGGLNHAHSPIHESESLKILDSVPTLAEHLHKYDLIITHYGITAFEALYVGTPVLLANPTKYHEKISKAAGFKTIKINKKITKNDKQEEKRKNSRITTPCSNRRFDCASVRNKSLTTLSNHCKNLAAKYKLDKESSNLASLIKSFSAQANRECPVCAAPSPKNSVARFKDRTYRRCTQCGIIFMDRICPAPIEYEKEYFFESYKKQYGKTYIEDFPNLTSMAKSRIKVLLKILSQSKRTKNSQEAKKLLDIGCAYGPFLATAKEEGFSTYGIDPAQDAVKYVKEELGIPAVKGFFPNSEIPDSSFDVITLWYVIEHFTNCKAALDKIKTLLKPNGILAFSTPSFSGISGKKNFKKFLSASPADHFTVWSPKTCKKALGLYGFKVKKIASCGHHPERFPLLGKLAHGKKSPLYRLLLVISKTLHLGDTFEVYAILI